MTVKEFKEFKERATNTLNVRVNEEQKMIVKELEELTKDYNPIVDTKEQKRGTIMNWEQRNCMHCKLRLGCPHSNLNLCNINPPSKTEFLTKVCEPNIIANNLIMKRSE